MPRLHKLATPGDYIGSVQYGFYDLVLDPDWIVERLEEIAHNQEVPMSEYDINHLADWLHSRMMSGLVHSLNDEPEPETCEDCDRAAEMEQVVSARGGYGQG